MQDLYQFILEYLIYRQAWKLGFLPFSNFKRLISFATGIFLYLCGKGFFVKKKNIKRSYSYRFIGPHDDETSSVEFS